MDFNVEEVNRLIAHRRSIFPVQYDQDKKVPDTVIEQMLENANWAPTHKITEPWRFMVFAGEGIKKLATYQAEKYKEVATEEGTFKEDKMQKLATKPLLCSHIIAIGMKRDAKEVVPEVEEVESVAAAVQNMYLTATAYGVGCYWGSGGITYYDGINDFFGLGEEDHLLGFLYVGMPKDGKWPQGKRKPITDKVSWVRE